ncbi:uncharacterized protein LOC107048913 [Diachasma alloeum]|uniref:uncharacterized protein LOC107048913 n=1 Tax=Diachasma alloeum TaxID=454923 RepID=UPI0007384897|nr:uncharacterized protein LOC107048913 [Diachasma alloeum]
MEKMGFTSALIGMLLIFTSTPTRARPQNDIVEADGFVFDGPADRPDKFPNDDGRIPRDFPPLNPTEPSPNPRDTSGTTTTTPSPAMARCMQNCPVTAQYNPVCGSDNVVYSNIGRLECAISCGTPVTFRYFGQCTSNVRGK